MDTLGNNNPKNEAYISVVAPVYNESDVIESVVKRWDSFMRTLGHKYEIVLCNDGSSDNTLEILRGLEKLMPSLCIIDGVVNRGYGAAMSMAIQHSVGEYIVTIDSDGQFDLEDIAGFLSVLQERTPTGINGRRKGKRDSLLRVIADRCFNIMVRVMFGTVLRDTNCAIKMIKGDKLRELLLESSSFAFPTEVCLKLEAQGLSLLEADVNHNERLGGMSKLKVLGTSISMAAFLFYLKFRIFLFRRKAIREL